jgi:photosystem II stability/assembly factor-like uncharacterized protein
MKLLTASFGWALTDRRLVSTKDAGKTWSDLTPIDAPGNTLKAAFFLDDTRAWTIAFDGETFRVYRSADHGHSWRAASIPANNKGGVRAVTIDFVDAAHGWIDVATGSEESDRADLFRTTDGGETWTALQLPGGRGARISFADASNGVAIAGPSSVYFTSDGGAHWRLAFTAPVPVSAPRFFGRAGVMLATAPSKGSTLLAFRSADAGATWTAAHPVDLPTGFAGPMVGSALSTARTKWLVGGDLFTVDEKFFVDSVAGLPYSVADLSFATNERGWAVGGTSCAPLPDPCAPHRLYETHDGGLAWSKLNP